jgi:hypothetical protein
MDVARTPDVPEPSVALLPDADSDSMASARDLADASRRAISPVSPAESQVDALPYAPRLGPPAADAVSDGWGAKLPPSTALQMLLVVDVTLTRQGLEDGALERALAHHGLPVQGTLEMDAALEASLLASRYFEPLEAGPTEAGARTDMVLLYVNARGGQVDDIWRSLREHPGEFSAVTIDVALMPADVAVFRDLRRVASELHRKNVAMADAATRQLRAEVHRLALSSTWRGTPARKLQGVSDLAGLVPGWMLGDASSAPPDRGEHAQPSAPAQPLAPGERLGENIDVEVLFVVHW